MVFVEPEHVWLVVLGFFLAFVLAFAVGANDVANSFGTSVGSKVLTLKQACLLASIFEVAGAAILGARVANTMLKGIIDIRNFNGTEEVLMMGHIASASGCSSWLLIATVFGLPVSGTHSIVGSVIGFTLIAKGLQGVRWIQVALVVSSWIISPILSGFASIALFYFIKWTILRREDALEAGLRLLPLFYGLTVFINVFSALYDGPGILSAEWMSIWMVFLFSTIIAILIAVVVFVFVIPRWRASITERVNKQSDKEAIPQFEQIQESTEAKAEAALHRSNLDFEAPPISKTGAATTDTAGSSGSSSQVQSDDSLLSNPSEISDPNERDDESSCGCTAPTQNKFLNKQRKYINDSPEVGELFKFLQILSAVFGAFAHGGNDVSNTVTPLIGIWFLATTRALYIKKDVPFWVLLYGGLGITAGLWILGRRVIKTIGEKLSKITPSSGFAIEFGSALTVLVASNLGIPLSTTHCKVGSVIFVGRVRSRTNVDWKLFRNIIIGWCVTVPITCGISAFIMYLLTNNLEISPLNPPTDNLFNGTFSVVGLNSSMIF